MQRNSYSPWSWSLDHASEVLDIQLLIINTYFIFIFIVYILIFSSSEFQLWFFSTVRVLFALSLFPVFILLGLNFPIIVSTSCFTLVIIW